MRKTLSAVLIVLLAGMPTLAQAQGSDKSDQSDWKKVATIEAGMTIELMVAGDVRADRLFVSANDAGMTVLNLSLPSLPRRVDEVLRKTAAERPESFGAERTTLKVGDDFLLNQDGVFLSGQRVAATKDVVIRIPRDRVLEISRQKKRSFPVWLGRILAVPLGYVVGALIARFAGGSVGSTRMKTIGVIAIPAAMGALWFFFSRVGSGDTIIYRAPSGAD